RGRCQPPLPRAAGSQPVELFNLSRQLRPAAQGDKSMEAYLLEWANLLLRWLHVIVAIAYIGSSFYFVWLDNSLRPPADEALRAQGGAGELWAVHAGAFYNPQKYALAPPHLPRDLHWFYWEAYS